MKTTITRTALFGPYLLDLRSGELWKFGIRVKIGEQSFRILCVLLDAQGEMVTREEIRTKLWAKDTFVDFDHGLNSAIQRLRDCLSDSAEKPRWIETIPRRGYRFVGQVVWQEGNGAAPVAAKKTEPPQTPVAPGAAPQAVERATRPWVVAAAILILLAAGLAIGYRTWKQSAKRQAGKMIRSLAVLPIENLSGDPSQDYFADGMTDELITMLAKNASLRVVSRTSVMQYKGMHRPVRDIASELGVDGILEGSVARSTSRIHLNVQLIYAPTDTHIWAESYDRDLNQAYSLPEELSQIVAKEVKVATSPTPTQRYINPEAHDAYLRGRYIWNGQNDQDSLSYFEKAIALQPDYALAWSGLADAYGIRAVDGFAPAKEVMAQNEAAARKAVQLDDSLPAAHVSLAAWYFFYGWDLQHALAEADRAVALDPNYADGHVIREHVLTAMNQADEAIREQKRYMELEPFVRPWALGYAYFHLRQFDNAIAELSMRAQARPTDVFTRFLLSNCYWLKGMWKESEQELEEGLKLSGSPEKAAAVHRAFERDGEKGAERWGVDDIKARARKGYVSPFDIASAYAFLGDKEQTLKFLEDAYREHSPNLIFLQNEPNFDVLHSDPRYQALVKKIGLPAY